MDSDDDILPATPEYLLRACELLKLVACEYARRLGPPTCIYESELGLHINWSRYTLHMFAEAEDESPFLYNLQIYSSKQDAPHLFTSEYYPNAHSVLAAALRH